ncbi:hypothetical protein [Chondromyces crocatus]|uniref:Uncharacterized protein n=1 Tax=Chondromyces crocatus TaxID=52 RepID=A0A0K1E7W6_CHOCO|nr:hypothetical protein [Chondromyces crocatus]AKT36954.1 uncharacterized protein CMC5_010750 [Chondromyces crocatus]
MAYEKDLVVLLPNKDAQFLLRGILSRMPEMGMRTPSVQFDTHPLRDAGCLDGDELLESQASRYEKALIFVADRTKSGREEMTREDLEARIEEGLNRTGWGSRGRAIVVDPGIDRWLLEHQLGETWSPMEGALSTALDIALRRRRLPRSSNLYEPLGERLVHEGLIDPAWRKLVAILRQWFRTEAQPLEKESSEVELRVRFDALVQKWLSETAHLSSLDAIVQHGAYREIIGMGPRVIPLILRDLEQEPKHWGTALRELTGENPIPPEHAGRVRLMAEDWVRWAKERGYDR